MISPILRIYYKKRWLPFAICERFKMNTLKFGLRGSMLTPVLIDISLNLLCMNCSNYIYFTDQAL